MKILSRIASPKLYLCIFYIVYPEYVTLIDIVSEYFSKQEMSP